MKAYKLVRLKKNGAITPLFINKTFEIPFCEWLVAESYPTNGFALRPYWHCTSHPKAPHLSKKGRVWAEVEIEDYQVINRPEAQGGKWFLANKIKFLRLLDINPQHCYTTYIFPRSFRRAGAKAK